MILYPLLHRRRWEFDHESWHTPRPDLFRSAPLGMVVIGHILAVL